MWPEKASGLPLDWIEIETQLRTFVLNLIPAGIYGGIAVLAHFSYQHVWVRWIFYSALILLTLLLLLGSGFFEFAGLFYYYQPDLLARQNALSSHPFSAEQFIWSGLGLGFAFLYSVAILIPFSRRPLMRLMSANPDSYPHMAGCILYMLTVVYFAASMTVLYDKESILAQLKEQSLVVSVASVFCAIFIVVSSGVGLFVRRGWRAALARLGVRKISWSEAGICVLLAVVMLGTLLGMDRLIIEPLFPESFKLNAEFDNAMSVTGEPWEIFLGCLVVATCAGVGEELLFRGLLQPAYGIWAASVLFALMHFHYGPSLLMVQIFIMGFAFGLIRNRFGTTGSMITHASFDFIALMISNLLVDFL